MLGDVLYILLNHIVMKKKCFLGLLGMTLALFACTSESSGLEGNDEDGNIEAVARWVVGAEAKGGGNVISLQTRAGHTEENCDRTCSDDKAFHKDCQGSGRECHVEGGLELEPMIPKAKELQGIRYVGRCLYPEDISDYETFAMPARSFKIEGETRWINIPPQILERDSRTHCFVVKNITFTDMPIYKNV